MKTVKEPISPDLVNAAASCKAIDSLVSARLLNAEHWIDQHASGTLRKSKLCGLNWRPQYYQERVAWEFGWEFESLPATRVTTGELVSAGDCKAITELGWHLERKLARNPFPGDVYVPAFVKADISLGKHGTAEPRCGIAIVLKRTSAQWIRNKHLIFAFISTEQPDGSYSKPVNPW